LHNEQCQTYRDELTHLKELSKQTYFKSKFNKYNDNANKIAQLIKNIITLENH